MRYFFTAGRWMFIFLTSFLSSVTWAEESFGVVFIAKGASCTITYDTSTITTVQDEMQPVTNIQDPDLSFTAETKEGYAFRGWWTMKENNDGQRPGEMAVCFSESQSVTAKEINEGAKVWRMTAGDGSASYKVVYLKYVPQYEITATVSPVGAGAITGSGLYDEGATATLRVTKTTEDFVFQHWENAVGEIVDEDATCEVTVTTNAAYTAMFLDRRKYKVEFYSEGKVVTNVTMVNNQALPPVNPLVREGYVFGGYYSGADGAGQRYYNADGISELEKWTTPGVSELYARWIPITYHLAFNGNGATAGTMDNQDLQYDAVVALPANAFINPGYTFCGWAKESTGSVIYADGACVTNLTATAQATVELFAVWKTNSYVIAFAGNGGTNDLPCMTCAYGQEVNLSSNQFLRENFVFAGWALDPTNEVAFADGSVVSNLTTKAEGVVWLYAQWIASAGPEVSEWSKALDCSRVNFTPQGENSNKWEIVTNAQAQGGTCVQVKVLPAKNDTHPILSGTIVGPGTLSFKYKTSICPNPYNDDTDNYEQPSKFTFVADKEKELEPTNDWGEIIWENSSKDAMEIKWFLFRDPATYDPRVNNDYALLDAVTWVSDTIPAQWVGVTFRDATGGVFTNVTRKTGEAYGELPAPLDPLGREFIHWECEGKKIDNAWVVPAVAASVEVISRWGEIPVVTNTVPTAIAGLVYDGGEKKGVLAGEGYTIVGNVATNAGNYTARATPTECHVWEGGFGGTTNIAWTVAKAAAPDVSGLGFADAVYEFDGNEKTIAVAGTIPAGIKVVYSGDPTNRTEVGTNVVTASFKVLDEVNYEAITKTLTAKLIITSKDGPSPLPPDPPPDDPQPDSGNYTPETNLVFATGEGMVNRYFAPVYLDQLGGFSRTYDKKTSVKAEGLPKGLKLVKTKVDDMYGYQIEGVPTESLDGVTRIAYVRITDAQKRVTFRPLTNLRILPATVAVFPPATNKVEYWRFPVSKIWPGYTDDTKQNWTFSGWPSGIKFASRDTFYNSRKVAAGDVYGQPTKVGTFTVKAVEKIVGTRYKNTHLATFIVRYEDGQNPNPTDKPMPAAVVELPTDMHETVATVKDVRQGVSYLWTLTNTLYSTVTVSGLPSGLKLASSNVLDKTTRKKTYFYRVTGIPTKAGYFLATFTAKLNGVSSVSTVAFNVEELPTWAQGTFDGGVGAFETSPGGQVTLTVSKVGKLSGKWMSLGTNWTLAAASYSRYDRENDCYYVDVVRKTGSGKKAVSFIEELQVSSTVLGGLAESDLFPAYQNNWKLEPWKTVGKAFSKAKELVYVPEGYATNETISLKFAASGKVTVKGKFVKSVSDKGKVTWYSVSGSAVLCPQTEPGEGNAFGGYVFAYLPPKAKTPLEDGGYAVRVPIIWDGTQFDVWKSDDE